MLLGVSLNMYRTQVKPDNLKQQDIDQFLQSYQTADHILLL
jgi:hypothetical protein